MAHGDDTNAVQLARLEGRVDGIERASARHVDRELYQSEKAGIVRELNELKAEIAQVRADQKTDRDKLAEQRRWVIGAVVVPALGTFVAVLMGVLS